jgi:hypothetical protein
MGCDYYILKVLKIYFSKNDVLEIELARIREYYSDFDAGWDEDVDSENYEVTSKEYDIYTLTPKMKPIIIYSDSSFGKLSFETKYKNIIENEIVKNGKKWSDITKVIKVEERYQP